MIGPAMLPIHTVRASAFNYDEIPAGYYHQAMLSGGKTQRFWHREKFKEVTRRIQPGERVLDFGCGPGSFLHILSEEKPGVQAVGIDIAGGQIEYAQKFFREKFPGAPVQFRTLSLESFELPFEDASFDVVTSIEVIEHIHPFLAAKALAEARRVLKPNGRLIVTTPNYRSLWPLIELVLERFSPVKYHEQHISKFTPNAFAKFLEICGFQVTRLNTIFIFAPFLAPLSPALAGLVFRAEKAIGRGMGSLLVGEARKLEW